MTAIFRVDASFEIGTGHVIRCLTLARELRRRGFEIVFVMRQLDGDLIDFVEHEGFKVIKLKRPEYNKCSDLQSHSSGLRVPWNEDCDEVRTAIKPAINGRKVLIIDHYSIDQRWETKLRDIVDEIVVIDDLADREHDCDALLDQNLTRNMNERYAKLVSVQCKKLIGPSYALLRDEFRTLRSRVKTRFGKVQHVLLFLGGTDIKNQTERLIRILTEVESHLQYDVVVGSSNPYKQKIQEICGRSKNVHFYYNIKNIAELMASADFSVGAAGTTTWERCSLGLPTAALIVAENQREVAITAHEYGIIYNLGEANSITDMELTSKVCALIKDERQRETISRRSMDMVDGRGVERVVDEFF